MFFAKYKYLELNVLKKRSTNYLNLSIHIEVELYFNLNGNHEPWIAMACLEVINIGNYNSMNTTFFCGVNTHREKTFLFDNTLSLEPLDLKP